MGGEMHIELESTRAYISLFPQTGCWVTTSIIDMFRRWFLHLPLDRRFIPRFTRIYIGMSPSQLPWQMKSGRLPTKISGSLLGGETSQSLHCLLQSWSLRWLPIFCTWDVYVFWWWCLALSNGFNTINSPSKGGRWCCFDFFPIISRFAFVSASQPICKKVSNWPPLTWKYLLHNNGTCSYLAFMLLFLAQKIGFKTWLFTYNPKLVNPLPANIGCDVVRFTIAAIPVFLDLSCPYAPCTEYLP